MRKFFTLFLVSMFCAGMAFSAMAQSISGTITDAKDGSALPGVSILQKGTTNGTISDVNGKFTLTLRADGQQTLQLSSIGYKTQEIALGGRSIFSISMEEDVAVLSDIVVIGYGKQEKRDVTGAMSTLKNTEFNVGVISSPEQLFQGKLSGVQVTQNSGEPGGGINVNIRGVNSIRSGNNPLYVVDGFPLDGREVSSAGIDFGLGNTSARNPLNFINPDDIESVDVLKDASATAIYGARGANGVVLITTKKAKAGENSFNVSSFFGIANVANKIELLNSSNYIAAAVATGAEAENINFGGSTDWQDEIFRTAITQSHSVSFAKGTEKSASRISLSYLTQEGIIKTSKLERFTARINNTQKLIKDRLTIDFQLTLGHTNDDYVPTTNNAGFEGNIIGAALGANPTIPVRRPDGTLIQRGETLQTPSGPVGLSTDFRNPIAMLELIDSKGKTTRALGNIGLTLNIAKGLDFRTNVGVDVSNSVTRTNFDPEYSINDGNTNLGAAGIFDVILTSHIVENTLNYKFTAGKSKVNALLGYSYQEFNSRGHSVWVYDTAIPGSPPLGTGNIGVGRDLNGLQQASFDQTNKIQSFFGRVNYSLQDKYLLTASLRADGSSRFGRNNRYGFFPSLALAWRLSEENFIPELFDDLKLRVGYGVTGNQEFANGVSQATLGVDPNSGAVTQLTPDNPNIKWEESTQLNVGFDFSVLRGRVFGTFDYFYRNTTDLLAQFNVPPPFPVPIAFSNLDANLINTGLEFNLNAIILDGSKTGGFRFDANFNITYFLRNEITGLGSSFFDTGEINGQGLSGAFAQRIAEGQPLGAFYMLEFNGFNDAGIATYGNDDRRVFVGKSAQPTHFYGFTTNFAYKGFDLSMNFYGRGGNYVYNNTANALFVRGALFNGRNVTPDVATSLEDPLNSPDVSTQFLEKGSFLRFNNFILGYTFKTTNIDWLNNLRLYFSGQNVFVITPYSGYDPEANIDKSIRGVPSFGIDYTGYPRSRTFIFGVNIGF